MIISEHNIYNIRYTSPGHFAGEVAWRSTRLLKIRIAAVRF